MYLYINTSTREEFTVALYNGSRFVAKRISRSQKKAAEKLLPSISKLLSSAKISIDDIGAILVAKGPGSFTSLRVGISCANALGYALSILVVGLKKEEDIKNIRFDNEKKRSLSFVIPEYGSEAQITVNKK